VLFFFEKGNMNIVLVGYRCSGKTAVGKLLADILEWDFLDTDLLIEQAEGSSIEAMVDKKGWDHFREVEREVVKRISEKDNLIIATGGGVVMNDENVKNLRDNGVVVWLKADVNILKERMDSDKESGRVRPSLTGDDPVVEIKKVLDIRIPFYQEAGDFEVDTGKLNIQQVADLIIERIDEIRSAD
jgi:shikimate kinase